MTKTMTDREWVELLEEMTDLYQQAADTTGIEADNYRLIGELRELRDNPTRAEKENVQLRLQLVSQRTEMAAAGNAALEKATRMLRNYEDAYPPVLAERDRLYREIFEANRHIAWLEQQAKLLMAFIRYWIEAYGVILPVEFDSLPDWLRAEIER